MQLVTQLILAGVLLFGGAGGRGAAAAMDLAQVRAAFDLLTERCAADDGQLWGRTIDGPMLIVDPGTREVVANAADTKGILTAIGDGMYRGVLPGSVSIGNTTVRWNDMQWAMVQWPLPRDEVYLGSLLVHESFHRVQPKMGLDLAMPANHHLDEQVGRTAMRLEMRALRAALESDTPLESEAVRDALLFRAFRQREYRAARNDERLLELNEGLAEYTGLRLGGAAPEDQVRRAAGGLTMYDGPGPLLRTFAYATGPAWCLLLDDAMPEWRTRVGRSTDLSRLLRRALKWKAPRPLDEAYLERASHYDVEEINIQEEARASARIERVEEFEARYVDGPVFVIALLGSYNYSFSPQLVESFGKHGTVYGRMRLTGPWGILDAPGGVLVSGEGRKRRAILPAPYAVGERPATGEGWTLKLNPGWRLREHQRTGNVELIAP